MGELYPVLSTLMAGVERVRAEKIKIGIVGTMRRVFQEQFGKGRFAELLAVDHNCDGWDFDDIVGKPKVTFEMLPLNVDPAPTAIYLHPGVK